VSKVEIKPFYEKNPILNDYSVNLTFHELIHLSDDDFVSWVKIMRHRLKEIWDTTDCPVSSGKSEDEIIDDFNKLSSYDVHKFGQFSDDNDTDSPDVINNTGYAGSSVNQFMPDMMRTPICYSLTSKNNYSIYDIVSDDKFQHSVELRAKRHLKKMDFIIIHPVYRKMILKPDLYPAKQQVIGLIVLIQTQIIFLLIMIIGYLRLNKKLKINYQQGIIKLDNLIFYTLLIKKLKYL
jgi:hypothetical protein